MMQHDIVLTILAVAERVKISLSAQISSEPSPNTCSYEIYPNLYVRKGQAKAQHIDQNTCCDSLLQYPLTTAGAWYASQHRYFCTPETMSVFLDSLMKT